MIFSPNFHFKHFPFVSHTHCLSQTHTELDCSDPYIEPNGTIHTPTHHDLHTTRERECASEITPAPFAPRTQSFNFAGDPETSCHEPRASTLNRTMNPELQLRIAPRTQSFNFESHPLTSPTNPEARIAVRLRLRIAPINFTDEPRGQDRRLTSTSLTPIALSSRLRNSWVLMNLTGFDEFFFVGF